MGTRGKKQRGRASGPGEVQGQSQLGVKRARGQENSNPKWLRYIGMGSWGKGSGSSALGKDRLKVRGRVRSAGRSRRS